MTDLKREFLEIKALIDELRALDIYFRVFGADNHRYDIGPTLSESEISKFEQQHQIKLPEDFRLYLQLVGNGSQHQENPQSQVIDWSNVSVGPDYGLLALREMSKSLVDGSFPFTSKAPLPSCGWHSFDDDTNTQGAITLNSQGCSGQTHLIVRGEDYGKVWESVEWTEFRPKHLNFFQWMRQWAEREIARLKNEQV